jgi:hypothetical protein
MFKEKTNFDAIIACADGNKVYAHKYILGQSKFFLDSGKLTCENNIAEFKVEESHLVINELLRFMYTGNVKNLHDMAISLLYASEKYSLIELKMICVRHLSLFLTYANFGSSLLAAHKLNLDRMKQVVVEFICKYVDKKLKFKFK